VDTEDLEDNLEEYEEVESVLDSATQNAGIDENSEEIPRCRFCWDTKAEPENPLFSTCKCSGSVGYIHFDCLKNWLDVKK
jgi:E3 ubiquitin-protein ligase DOA10